MSAPDFGFTPSGNIFKKREALLEEWTPNVLVGRDDELRRYHNALQPVIEGETPSNIFLYGRSGVGKTAATRFLFNQLKTDAEQIDGLDLTTIEINCDGLNTSYQTAVAIVNALREPENQISNTGYPQASVYEFMFEALDDVGGTVLIVLDEVDHIEDDSILYKLPRARSNGDVSNARLGVIGISNDLRFREQLSSKVRSSLCEKELSFSAYNANELSEVLEQRVSVAFHDDAIHSSVTPKCAAHGAKDSGDARQALDLLLESGDVARERDADQVLQKHVDIALERLQKDRIVDGISKTSDHAQLTLLALTNLKKQDLTPARTRAVKEAYDRICEQEGFDPITLRSVRDHLSEFATLGIVSSTEINQGESGGKYKEHELQQPEHIVRAGVSEIVQAP